MCERYGIKGFIPVSMLDWPGKISSVMFLGGCGFRCPACHNHRLVLDADALPDIPLDEIIRYVNSRNTWIDGITITGGEPTSSKNLPDLLEALKRSNLKIKLDTNGSNPAMLEELVWGCLVDAIHMDVKAPITRDDYARVAGVRIDPETILRSVDILKRSRLEVLFRTTVIPGMVEEDELVRIQYALGDVPWYRIQAFRNVDTLNPRLEELPLFPIERVAEMRRRFEIPSNHSVKAYACAG